MMDMDAIEYFFSKQDRFNISLDLNFERKTKKIIQEANAPLRVHEKKQPSSPKNDPFYSEWEKKYKELQSLALLAKEPFNKHALFIIKQGDPEDFARQICDAINSRIMKTTFIVLTGLLSDVIEELNPSHLILNSNIYNTSNLPSIYFDDLKEIKKDSEKKKLLWNLLKETLKG